MASIESRSAVFGFRTCAGFGLALRFNALLATLVAFAAFAFGDNLVIPLPNPL
jgi:hypothetical protein